MVTDTPLSPVQLSFRSAMANLSAAVNVVTTDGAAGRAGVTVSAACSVTDAPPTMLLCVNRSSRSHDVVLANGRVCINVLGDDHEEIARCFAGATGVSGEDRFAVGSWDLTTHGVPVLRDALTSLVGRIVSTREHGSHTVAFVEVDAVASGRDEGALVYFQRRFHGLRQDALSA
jgi:flavin reductase (NADH)